MAQAAAIVLADALATPVNHTFIPQGKIGQVWWFEDQTGSQSIGWNKISIEFTRNVAERLATGAKSTAYTNRVKIGIHTPKLEVLGNNANGLIAPAQVAYTPRCFIEFVLSERSLLQDRQDLRKYSQFLMADTQVVAMVEALQSIYG